MPNIGGPSFRRRLMLSGVVHSIILYGAPVWRKVIRIGRHKNRLTSTQRKALLRVAMAYRTTSAAALQVITGTPPIDVLVEERGRIHDREGGNKDKARKEERDRTLGIWQRRWEEEDRVAAWTKVLIPNLVAWYGCEHRNLGYYLTQFLTGHGSFRTYTRRIGKEEVDECSYCGASDTAEHTVLRCPRWDVFRESVDWWTQDIQPARIIEEMIGDKNRWKEAETVIVQIMENKEVQERIRQEGG